MNSYKVLLPVRRGSNRVKLKNLRLLGDKSLIELAIDRVIPLHYDVVVNSNISQLADLCKDYQIEFYQRADALATSSSLIDDYIYDFMTHMEESHLIIINPTSPFFSTERIAEAVLCYEMSEKDILLSCERVQTHCLLQSEPLNFDADQKHPRSQDLTPVHALNFAITILNARKFKAAYEKNGYGLYQGSIFIFETRGEENIDVDTEEDFAAAERFLDVRDNLNNSGARYHPIAEEIINSFDIVED